jgi:hypothetical protein
MKWSNVQIMAKAVDIKLDYACGNQIQEAEL